MSTDNPRVAAYLQPSNHELLKAFATEYEFSLSQAVDYIIADYLGGGIPTKPTGSTPVKAEEIDGLEALVEAVVEAQSQFIMDSTSQRLQELQRTLETSILKEVQVLKEELRDIRLGNIPVTYQEHTSQDVEDVAISSLPKDNFPELTVGSTPQYTSDIPVSQPDSLALSAPDIIQPSQPTNTRGNTQQHTGDTPESEKSGLKQTQLAERLAVDSSAITRQKKKEGFTEWSKRHDPDNVGWIYETASKRFFKAENTSSDEGIDISSDQQSDDL